MKLRLDRIHHPVTALGPGRRVGIWFQGCSLGCPGCLSRDTWPADAAEQTTVEQVVAAVERLAPDGVDGITISGGEPFEQPAALHDLVRALRDWGRRTGGEPDLLVYSGRALADLAAEHPEVLADLDALIPEPYRAEVPPTGPWHGSGNQPLVLLSELGRARFASADVDAAPRLQVAVTDGVVWMIGIPRPGDLPRLSAALAARGIELREVSWRR